MYKCIIKNIGAISTIHILANKHILCRCDDNNSIKQHIQYNRHIVKHEQSLFSDIYDKYNDWTIDYKNITFAEVVQLMESKLVNEFGNGVYKEHVICFYKIYYEMNQEFTTLGDITFMSEVRPQDAMQLVPEWFEEMSSGKGITVDYYGMHCEQNKLNKLALKIEPKLHVYIYVNNQYYGYVIKN